MGEISDLVKVLSVKKKKKFNSAVILASGNGKRFDSEQTKQFVLLDGIPIFIRSIMAFEHSTETDEIVLVTREADIKGCRNLIADYGITKVTRIVAGGDTRQDSARLGFEAVNPACEFVAIHDAARCLVTSEMIDKTFIEAYVVGAAACGARTTDTLKKVNFGNSITETIDRDTVWSVHTPQIFMSEMYRAAVYTAKKDNFTATDDCALCERLGFKIRLVDCGKTNMKITYPEDIAIAKAILEYRKTEVSK
jgi:2-C-methyl-D-erythritol 4-phosphate cytidylyltransferase